MTNLPGYTCKETLSCSNNHNLTCRERRSYSIFAKKQARVGKTVVPDKKPKSTPKKKDTTTSKGWVYYTVKSGDSPYTIAKKYNGVDEDDIMKLNGITNPRNLKVGQKLKIRKK